MAGTVTQERASAAIGFKIPWLPALTLAVHPIAAEGTQKFLPASLQLLLQPPSETD